MFVFGQLQRFLNPFGATDLESSTLQVILVLGSAKASFKFHKVIPQFEEILIPDKTSV